MDCRYRLSNTPFIESGESYSKASDYLYEYIMERTSDTIDIDYETVYNDFKEIRLFQVGQMAWDGEIDMDTDGNHETIKILGKKNHFHYIRRQKGEN